MFGRVEKVTDDLMWKEKPVFTNEKQDKALVRIREKGVINTMINDFVHTGSVSRSQSDQLVDKDERE